MDEFETAVANLSDEHGNVNDADMMKLLTGGSPVAGDTGAKPDSGAPTPDADDTDTEDKDKAPAKGDDDKTPTPDAKDAPTEKPEPTAEPEPVLLAKDGKHTIDYQKLVDARTEAANAKAEAQALREELAAARKAPAKDDAPKDAPTDDKPLFGDYTDADLKKGVDAIVAEKLAAFKATLDPTLTALQKDTQETAWIKHMAPVYEAHPDADSIVASTEFEAYKAAQPSFVRKGIDEALTKGTSAELVEVFSAYRAANPVKTAAAPAPAPAAPAPAPAAGKKTPAELAQEVIDKTKARTPTSLSDIPAGSQAHHDEGEAMAEMSSLDLMGKFAGKTPAQIEALLSRVL